MKTLVVYYSRKGYTEEIAMQKVKEENADFLCLDTIENTCGWYGFLNCAKLFLEKKQMVLFPYETDIASYDKVIICSPVWFGKICSPIDEFIKKERHNIKCAEYVLLHSLPENVKGIANYLDTILRIKSESTTSIQCIAGHIIKVEEL